jgi:uncharacterized protein (UPF0335 family)
MESFINDFYNDRLSTLKDSYTIKKNQLREYVLAIEEERIEQERKAALEEEKKAAAAKKKAAKKPTIFKPRE